MTYAKFGAFFCDCGAKDDGTCEALVRRLAAAPEADEGAEARHVGGGVGGALAHRTPVETSLAAAFRRRPSSPSALLDHVVRWTSIVMF